MKESVVSLDQLDTMAQQLYELKDHCAVYLFEGPLGAGKTTLIRLLLHKWGIQDPIVSPTFTYVNIYINKKNEILYHFDLYRIETLNQFIQLGFDEYLYQENSWSFIEWPELIMPLIKKRACFIRIEYKDEKTRLITYDFISAIE